MAQVNELKAEEIQDKPFEQQTEGIAENELGSIEAPEDNEVVAAPTAVDADEAGAEAVKPTTSAQDFYDQLYQNPAYSPEEMKKIQRRERAEKAIAALGDIGSTVTNMVSGRKGAAVPQQTPESSLSKLYQDRWDKWKAQYQQNVDKYNNGRANAVAQDRAQTLADRKQKLYERKEDRLKAASDIQAQLNEERRLKMQLEMALGQAKNEAQVAKINKDIEYTQQRIDALRDKQEHPERYWKPTSQKSSQPTITTSWEDKEGKHVVKQPYNGNAGSSNVKKSKTQI